MCPVAIWRNCDTADPLLLSLGVGHAVVVALLGLVATVLAWSGVTLADDTTALARVDVQPLGGTLERVRAVGSDGRIIRSRCATGA